jgi:hypothetical protein
MDAFNPAEVTFVKNENVVEVNTLNYQWLDAVSQWLNALCIDYTVTETGLIVVRLDSSQTVACVCDAVRQTSAPVDCINLR